MNYNMISNDSSNNVDNDNYIDNSNGFDNDNYNEHNAAGDSNDDDGGGNGGYGWTQYPEGWITFKSDIMYCNGPHGSAVPLCTIMSKEVLQMASISIVRRFDNIWPRGNTSILKQH